MAAIVRRTALVLSVVLASMGLGAVWAATQPPSYRSIAVLDGSVTDVDSVTVRELFRSSTGHDATSPIQPVVTGDDGSTRVVVDAPDPGVSQALAQSYADAAVEAGSSDPNVSIQQRERAQYPSAAHSPNLARVAASSAALGTCIGAIAALAMERRSRRSANPVVVALTVPEYLTEPTPAHVESVAIPPTSVPRIPLELQQRHGPPARRGRGSRVASER